MENKFTRGIQERQQRALSADSSESTAGSSGENTPAKNSFPSIEDYIDQTSNRKAKNKTFYLDCAVLDALKKAAQKQQIAESKLVNDILKKVLLSQNH